VSGVGTVGDDVGRYTAATTSSDGHLHVFYLDATTHRLRHGDFDGSTWTFSNLDGPGVAGGNGRTSHNVGTSVAAAPKAPVGVIDVVYSDDTTHALRHARWSSGIWTFETIDGTGALTVGHTTDAVGLDNAAVYGGAFTQQLLAFTGDTTTGDLRRACTLGPGILPPAVCD